MVTIAFEDGATGIVDISTTATIEKPRFYLVGDEATFSKYGVDPQEKEMVNGDIDKAVEPVNLYGKLKKTNNEEKVIPTVPGCWKKYYENISDILQGKDVKPLVTLESIRRTMAVIDVAFKSAKANEPRSVY